MQVVCRMLDLFYTLGLDRPLNPLDPSLFSGRKSALGDFETLKTLVPPRIGGLGGRMQDIEADITDVCTPREIVGWASLSNDSIVFPLDSSCPRYPESAC